MIGTVIQAVEGRLHISLTCHSACAHCQSNKSCGFAESQEKEIDIEHADWRQFAPGDRVEVDIRESQGLLAVLIAYLLPAILALVVLLVTYNPWGELRAAGATLAFIALYFVALRLLRGKLQRHFTYSVKKA